MAKAKGFEMAEDGDASIQPGAMVDSTVQPIVYATEIPADMRDDRPRQDKTRPGGQIVRKHMGKFIVVDAENRQIPGVMFDPVRGKVVEANG